MTETGWPAQPAFLRTPVHPGQADTLVHFCGRGKPTASPEVANLTAPERLDSILRSGVIRAFPPYGRSWPVVCFSESDSGGVEAMLTLAGWEPWGLVVTRDWVWQQGGGPVWYVRDEIEQSLPPMTERTRSWLITTEPQRNDWLHEREWRLPLMSPSYKAVRLDAVKAILVGNRDWEPGLVDDIDVDPFDGGYAHVETTPRIARVPRWCWNGQRIEELPPVRVRVESHGSI